MFEASCIAEVTPNFEMDVEIGLRVLVGLESSRGCFLGTNRCDYTSKSKMTFLCCTRRLHGAL